jgi:REP element-mobilizing transposase RayT
MPHTYSYLAYHIVFSTKGRAQSINRELASNLHAYIGGIVREEGGVPVIINGVPDHVHLLVILPASISIANLLRVVKTNSSKWIHQKWPDHSSFGWQAGYGAFSVSRSVMDKTEKYIFQQEEHHRKMTFQEEFLMLLKQHNIEYDERYIWD